MKFGIGILIDTELISSDVTESLFNELKAEKGVNLENDFLGSKFVATGSKFVSINQPTILANSSISVFEELLNNWKKRQIDHPAHLTPSSPTSNS